jgi:hypothetical protein
MKPIATATPKKSNDRQHRITLLMSPVRKDKTLQAIAI